MTKAKRKSALAEGQLPLGFDPPALPEAHADLAGFDRRVAASVARILREDPATRFEIAGRVSELLDEDVSKLMLDAYASEARDGHNISVARFLALVAATHRYDVLDALVRLIGATLLVGEEVYTAELGHIETQIRALEARKRGLRPLAKTIERGRR